MMQLKKRVLAVFGTRPEAIKIAPIIKALRARPDAFDLELCVTAQHRQMLDQVLELFDLVPDYDLDLMRPGQTLTHVTIETLAGVQSILQQAEHAFDVILVVGDTTTAFAASLAAFYEKVAVGHVEAGLRTYDLQAPWPEELNRRLVGVMADLHFAPTDQAASNLRREAMPSDRISVTGNTVIDALLAVKDKLETDNSLKDQMDSAFSFIQPDKRMILVTGHRRENFGQGFLEICEGLREIADDFNDVQLVYPVHLNPNVRKPVNAILAGADNIHLIEPQDYLPFVYLMNRAHFIITDSGGIQEEAPSLGKPVLVMRDTTERPEGVQAGTAKLVGASRKNIVLAARELLTNQSTYDAMASAHNPYGDGKAAEYIVKCLSDHQFI